MRNTIDIEAQFGECDPIGIVYYPNYFRWFDLGFTKLMAAASLSPQSRLDAQGVRFPLVDVGARFLGPVEPGERLLLTSAVAECSGKVVTFAHVLSLDGTPRVEGHEKRVWAIAGPGGGRDLKAAPVPEDIRTVLLADRDYTPVP
jgi:4-hydroxybenzoyl-CoA thioesterase